MALLMIIFGLWTILNNHNDGHQASSASANAHSAVDQRKDDRKGT
jgi:hypothetical protein